MKLLRLLSLRHTFMLAALSILLGGCSALSLSYSNLDWLINWRLNDMLDLSPPQQEWLEPRLQADLNWHCSSELPRYLDWMHHTQNLINEPNPSPEKLTAQFTAAGEALRRIGTQITPTTIGLLKSLSDEQVAHFSEKLTEETEKYREKFVQPPIAVQIKERSERMADRLEGWLGKLDASQLKRIDRWAAGLGAQNSLWLNNRLRWQAQMEKNLAIRKTDAFAEQMARLLQSPQDYYDAQYREAYPQAQQALAELLSDLLVSADAEQKQHLTERLRDMRQELAQLICAQDVD